MLRPSALLSLRKQTKPDPTLSQPHLWFREPWLGSGAAGQAQPGPGEALPAPGAEPAQSRCVGGWLRLAWRGCRTGTGAEQLWHTGHTECAGLSCWSRHGAARDGPGNCWGSVSSAPGLGKGFLLGFLLLMHSLGLFSPLSPGSEVCALIAAPALCGHHTDAALLPQNRGSQCLLSSPLTGT